VLGDVDGNLAEAAALAAAEAETWRPALSDVLLPDVSPFAGLGSGQDFGDPIQDIDPRKGYLMSMHSLGNLECAAGAYQADELSEAGLMQDGCGVPVSSSLLPDIDSVLTNTGIAQEAAHGRRDYLLSVTSIGTEHLPQTVGSAHLLLAASPLELMHEDWDNPSERSSLDAANHWQAEGRYDDGEAMSRQNSKLPSSSTVPLTSRDVPRAKALGKGTRQSPIANACKYPSQLGNEGRRAKIPVTSSLLVENPYRIGASTGPQGDAHVEQNGSHWHRGEESAGLLLQQPLPPRQQPRPQQRYAQAPQGRVQEEVAAEAQPNAAGWWIDSALRWLPWSTQEEDPHPAKGGAGQRTSLVQQLELMGYGNRQAVEAARRCSSVEAAVEWLDMHH